MTNDPWGGEPRPVLSARQRERSRYLVLVLVLILAALILTVHFATGGKDAKAGKLIFATDPIPVSKHFSVLLPGDRLDVAVTIRSSVPDDLAARGYDAPDDGRFVGLQVIHAAGGGPTVATFGDPNGANTGGTRLHLLADGHRYPLTPSEFASDDEPPVPLAVYVPVAGDPSSLRLEVTWAGRSQSIDLRSGKRHAGDFALLYTQPDYHLSSCGTPRYSGGYTAQYAPATCRYQAVRMPYVVGRGWAPTGKAWFVIRIETGQPKGLLAHPAGASPVPYYIDTFPDRNPADRLDDDKPIVANDAVGYDPYGTAAELLYSVPRSGDSGHTLSVVQKTSAYARVKRAGVRFDVTVTQTWAVRIR